MANRVVPEAGEVRLEGSSSGPADSELGAYVIVMANRQHYVWRCDRWVCDSLDPQTRQALITIQIAEGEDLLQRRDTPDDAARLAMAVLRGDRTAALLLADLVSEQYVAGL